MKILVRPENKNDYNAVERLAREAFWNLYYPGCDEHYLCHILRNHKDFLPELDYIAELDGAVVGSIMYSRSFLIDENNEETEIVSFGPFCVHPGIQRKGVGTQLLNFTKKLVQQKGIPAIVIYGDPHNYCKHGFKNGMDYHVSNMEGEYPLGLLVLETTPGFFGDKKYKIKQSDVFHFEHSLVEEFDQRFEKKIKEVQYSQELFKMQIRAYLKKS